MKNIALLILTLLATTFNYAQNIGINETNPTNSLHIKPITLGDNPLRVEGLQAYTIGDSSILVINPNSGIVKYMNASELSNSLLNSTVINNISDSLISNSTFINNFGDSLFLSQNFIDSLTSHLYNNGDTLLYNSSFINSLRDSIDTDVDSIRLTGTILHVYENGNDLTADLSTLTDNDSDPTNEHNTNVTLTGNTLSITDLGGTINIDLTPIVDNAVNQAKTPSGAIFAFPTSTPPTGYLACDGQAVSRTTYSDLFTLIGTMYGAGDGSTTFNLPDYNGQFLRGFDNGAGIDPDATSRTDRGDGTTGDAVGTKQTNQTLAHNHTVNPPATNSNTTGAHTHTVNPPATNTNTDGAHTHSIDPPATNTNSTGAHAHTVNPPATNTSTAGNHTHSVDPPNTSTSTNGNHDHTVNNQGGNFQSFIGFARSDINPGTAADGTGYNGGNAGPGSNDRIMNINAAGNHNHTVNIAAFNSAASGNHSHSVDIPQFNSNNTGNHTHSVNIASFNSASAGNHTHSVDIAQFNSGNTGSHTHSVDIAQFNSGNNGGTETRPTNISVLWCIKF